MDKSLKRIFSLIGIVSVLLLFSSSASASVALSNVVKLSQGENIEVASGGVLTINVVGEHFTLGPDGAAFSLSWDPAVLGYLSSAVANPPWNTSYVSEDQVSAGLIDYAFLGVTTVGANAGSDFEIASFSFNVLGDIGEATSLALGIDSFDIGFISGQELLNVNYINSEVRVVPLPAAVWMFGAGLAGMMGSIRRGK